MRATPWCTAPTAQRAVRQWERPAGEDMLAGFTLPLGDLLAGIP